jgi:hypothetical protein
MGEADTLDLALAILGVQLVLPLVVARFVDVW